MLSGVSAFLKVGYNDVGINKGQTHAVSFFHDANAPIDICGVAIFQVIGELAGYVETGIESLMTDQHAFLEGAPREHLGWTMTTKMEETTLAIGDGCVAIDHGWEG